MTLEINNVHHSSPRLSPASKNNNKLRKPQASCTVQVTGQLGIILLLSSCRISPYSLGFVFLRPPSVINVSSLHAKQLNETVNRDAGEGRTSKACFPLFDSILRAIAVLCGYRWSWGLSWYDLVPRQGLQSPRFTTYVLKPTIYNERSEALAWKCAYIHFRTSQFWNTQIFSRP